MAYSTFTNALTQAKRNSLLKQTPFTTRDMRNLHGGYMQTAGQRVADERSYNLGNQSLSAQTNYWANQLANDRDISGMTLAQQLATAQGDWANAQTIAAATNQANTNIATNTNNTNTDINTATNLANTNNTDKTIAANQKIAADQKDAADKASSNQLTGNIITGGAGLGGAYLLSGNKTVGNAISGVKNLITGGGANAATTTTAPVDSALTQQGPYLTADPGLTPTTTQPLDASQAVTNTNTGGAQLVPGDTVGATAASQISGAGGGGAGLVQGGDGLGASLVPGDAGSLAGATPLTDIGGGAYDLTSAPVGYSDWGVGGGATAAGVEGSGSAVGGVASTAGQVAGAAAAGVSLYDALKTGSGKSYFNTGVGLASIFAPQVGAFFGAAQIPSMLSGPERGPNSQDIAEYESGYNTVAEAAKKAGTRVPTIAEYNAIMGGNGLMVGMGRGGGKAYVDLFNERINSGIPGSFEGSAALRFDPSTMKYVGPNETAAVDSSVYFKGGL